MTIMALVVLREVPRKGEKVMNVECMECRKKFRTKKILPECPNCGGSDIDLEIIAKAVVNKKKIRQLRKYKSHVLGGLV